MRIKPFYRNHPVIAYFLLAYAVSWVGSFLAVGPRFYRGEILQLNDIWVVGLIMLLTPGFLGVTLTYSLDGKSGLRNLFFGMAKWRVGGRWYLALFIFPTLILVTLQRLATQVSVDFRPNFFPLGIMMGLLAGFLEEIGWMGFAFPIMKTKFSALTTSVLLGVLHAFWHFGADFAGASVIRGVYWLPHFLAFSASMVAVRIILVWVYVNTESLLMAQLMHASSSGFLAILVPMSLSPGYDTLFYILYTIILWMAALVIMIRYDKHFLRHPRPSGSYP